MYLIFFAGGFPPGSSEFISRPGHSPYAQQSGKYSFSIFFYCMAGNSLYSVTLKYEAVACTDLNVLLIKSFNKSRV
jgi:hypothetical protein